MFYLSHQQHPWLIAIAYDQGNSFKLECSGTIMSSQYAITGAHCFKSNDFNQHLKVLMRTTDPSIQREATRIVVDIASHKLHPRYVPGVGFYDIAVVKFATEIDLVNLDPEHPSIHS